jgi:Mg2+/Co2+ transporter CorC
LVYRWDTHIEDLIVNKRTSWNWLKKEEEAEREAGGRHLFPVTPPFSPEEIHALLHDGGEPIPTLSREPRGVPDEDNHKEQQNDPPQPAAVHREQKAEQILPEPPTSGALRISTLMVPCSELPILDVRQPLEDNIRNIEQSPYSSFPVTNGGLHDILGVSTAKQLLLMALAGEKMDLRQNLEPPVFVPETLGVASLLEKLRSSEADFAFVVDEFGELAGTVALRDLIDALTGKFKPRQGEETQAVQRQDGSWLLDGSIAIMKVKDRLKLRAVPEEGQNHYQTLAGMMMLLLGKLPQTGDRAEWESWQLEVISLAGRRIGKVLATWRPPKTSVSSKNGRGDAEMPELRAGDFLNP